MLLIWNQPLERKHHKKAFQEKMETNGQDMANDPGSFWDILVPPNPPN
jgi:hypothetical protein